MADFEDAATGGQPPVIGSPPIPVTHDVWHHAAATYDGTAPGACISTASSTRTLARRQASRRGPTSIQHAAIGTAHDLDRRCRRLLPRPHRRGAHLERRPAARPRSRPARFDELTTRHRPDRPLRPERGQRHRPSASSVGRRPDGTTVASPTWVAGFPLPDLRPARRADRPHRDGRQQPRRPRPGAPTASPTWPATASTAAPACPSTRPATASAARRSSRAPATPTRPRSTARPTTTSSSPSTARATRSPASDDASARRRRPAAGSALPVRRHRTTTSPSAARPSLGVDQLHPRDLVQAHRRGRRRDHRHRRHRQRDPARSPRAAPRPRRRPTST